MADHGEQRTRSQHHVSIAGEPQPSRPGAMSTANQTSEDNGTSEDLEIEPAEGEAEIVERHKKKEEKERKFPGNVFRRGWDWVVKELGWIPTKMNFSALKPVLRASFATWISLVLFLIPAVERTMGMASFLIIILAFISPPIEPFAGVVEKEVITLLLVIASWAWSCLTIKLANLARNEYIWNATSKEILSGKFIEAGPCAIYAIFLFVWSGLILWIRAKMGPGPFLPATAFACLCIDVSLTTAPLYPYPRYSLGQSVVVPIAFHSAVAIITSAFILPETVNAQFVKRLKLVMGPLTQAIKGQKDILNTSPLSDAFHPDTFALLITQAEAALTPLAASARLLKRDLSWGRLNANDLRELQMFARKLTMKAAGMAHFYRIMDTRRMKFPVTPMASRRTTPASTPASTRTTSPTPSDHDHDDHRSHSRVSFDQGSHHHQTHSGLLSFSNSAISLQRKLHPRQRHTLFRTHLLKDALSQSGDQSPVGVFESQYYMNIEKRLHHPREEEFEARSVELLAESCEDLLEALGDAMEHVVVWLDQMNTDRFRWPRLPKEGNEALLEKHHQFLEILKTEMDLFINEKRHKILEPYRVVADDPLRKSCHIPPHRFLFRSFLYQYHLLRMSEGVRNMLQNIEELDRIRTKSRLWPPVLPLKAIFTWSSWETNEFTERADDENPDVIPGLVSNGQELGSADPRNPDALPPRNMPEYVGSKIDQFLHELASGNALFALKAGICSVLLALISYFKSSASFAYQNKSLWALFIAQLTMSRYRGDTMFGFLTRVFATGFGLLFGLVFWYIGAGDGPGNPYGLAAVGAVAFPVMMLFRTYKPGPPATTIIFGTTVALIIGYSYIDTHNPTPGSPGFGATVAWRRFLLVMIGVTVSAIFSFLPPATTIRKYHRAALATTTMEIGYLYCAIVSYAATRQVEDSKNITRNLIAFRAKLCRLRAQTANVQYEFSMSGRWPKGRYKHVLDLQLDIGYFLSHFLSVIEQLEPNWSKAFLRRTRFVDAEFLGDVLAVITMMSTALRTGTPLPQITPTPLLDRFWRENYGLNIVRQETADEYGVPQTVTFETLKNEQYMYFSVGVSRAHSIVAHLDRLMLATKELVGEQFHVDGVHLPPIMRESLEGDGKKEPHSVHSRV